MHVYILKVTSSLEWPGNKARLAVMQMVCACFGCTVPHKPSFMVYTDKLLHILMEAELITAS